MVNLGIAYETIKGTLSDKPGDERKDGRLGHLGIKNIPNDFHQMHLLSKTLIKSKMALTQSKCQSFCRSLPAQFLNIV